MILRSWVQVPPLPIINIGVAKWQLGQPHQDQGDRAAPGEELGEASEEEQDVASEEIQGDAPGVARVTVAAGAAGQGQAEKARSNNQCGLPDTVRVKAAVSPKYT